MNTWHDIKTQEDIDLLMSVYGNFHDACIVSLNFKSLVISILSRSGYAEADLYHNPNYLPETDSILLAAVEAYKIHQ